MIASMHEIKGILMCSASQIYTLMSIQKGAAYAHQDIHFISAVFMLVTGTGSLAQDTNSDDDANEQSPVTYAAHSVVR